MDNVVLLESFARRVFRQLEGFGSYGFPESHAASFALLVYVSSYIKHFHPDVFAAALLNSLPMGFYQPAQIVIDAQKHKVVVNPVDINYSQWHNILEEKDGKYCPLRLGFRQAKGLTKEDMELLIAARTKPFSNMQQLWRAGISIAALERLADADAFRSIGLDRRQALWEVASLQDLPKGIFKEHNNAPDNEGIILPSMTLAEHVLQDYSSTTLSIKAHPVSFVRQRLFNMRTFKAEELQKLTDGTWLRVAGLVLVRQRPGTATGLCFITLEDETGVANLVVFRKRFDKYRKEIVQSRLMMAEGRLQREGAVIHMVVHRCYNMNHLLQDMAIPEQAPLLITQQPANDSTGKEPKVVQADIFYGGRNFR